MTRQRCLDAAQILNECRDSVENVFIVWDSWFNSFVLAVGCSERKKDKMSEETNTEVEKQLKNT